MNGEAKRRARKLAQAAIPLTTCEMCGKPATDRHHTNYSKPLEVIQLCRACHIQVEADVLREKGKHGAAMRWSGHTMLSECIKCGMQFTRSRARQKTCSRSCGNKRAWERRRGSIQSPKSRE